ncbi:MAG: 6-bladed beta-propeller [Dysgonamonadaceae bacterium]|jgi:hypothetical protein|nr:6-bladed beta-propeller [Dysgonamonadaceae bacterium]
MRQQILDLLLIPSIFLLFWSCANNREKYGEINYERCFYLQENIDFCGNLNSFCFLDESHLVVSTKENPSVFVYDEMGKQILQIFQRGNGPFEYINPAIVRCDKDRKIYVWCSELLKMIVFDENGNPQNEFRFNRAVKDFLVYRDFVFMYLAGGFDSVVEVYNISSSKILTSIGDATEEHKLLSINDSAGGIALLNQSIIFTGADGLDFNLCNIRNNSTNVEVITHRTKDLESFKKEPLKGITTVSLMNNDRSKAIDYISRNSVINGLFVTDNNVIVKAKSGTVKIKNEGIIDNSRYDNFYFFDKELNYLFEQDNFWKTNDFLVYDNLYATDGKDIYFIAVSRNSGEENQYSLNRLLFSKPIK